MLSAHPPDTAFCLCTREWARGGGGKKGRGCSGGGRLGGVKDDSNSPHVTKMPSSNPYSPTTTTTFFFFQRAPSNFSHPYRAERVRRVPVVAVGTEEKKKNQKSRRAKQTNRWLLWLTGDVRPLAFIQLAPSEPVCPATCVFPSSSQPCRARHPKRNFKTWP